MTGRILKMENWPELRESMNNIFKLVFPTREVSGELKQFVFTAASLASGCLHCQSHGSYHLHRIGVSDEKIQAMWTYQDSDLFTEAERAALDLAFAAGVAPNAVEPENFEELRKHFTDTQIIEILAVIAVGGFLNRWNDTIATVTDQESVDWASEVLAQVGWDAVSTRGRQRSSAKRIPSPWAGQINNLDKDQGRSHSGVCLHVLSAPSRLLRSISQVGAAHA